MGIPQADLSRFRQMQLLLTAIIILLCKAACHGRRLSWYALVISTEPESSVGFVFLSGRRGLGKPTNRDKHAGWSSAHAAALGVERRRINVGTLSIGPGRVLAVWVSTSN